jgi:hypothetical protein
MAGLPHHRREELIARRHRRWIYERTAVIERYAPAAAEKAERLLGAPETLASQRLLRDIPHVPPDAFR